VLKYNREIAIICHKYLILLYLLGVFVYPKNHCHAQSLNFKAVKIRLVTNKIINAKDVFIKNDSLISSIREDSTIKLSLHTIAQLHYSNQNRRFEGAVLGFLIGLTLPLKFMNSYNNPSDFLIVPVFIIFGQAIGSDIYYDWQEFDLDAYRGNALQPYFSFGNHGIGIGLRIPLRR